MGNQGQSVQERFYSRYSFVQAIEDHNFGLIKVYRKKQLNFDYVMVLEQRYSSAQMAQTKLQIENIRRNYTLQSDTALLRILNVEEVGGGACEPSCLRIYMEYLNFTLRDAVRMRKQARSPFFPDEIMYVVQSALTAYLFLKKIEANYISLRPDTIYINPDGLVRFNPIRIESFPAESSTCECIPQTRQIVYQKTERQFLCELKSMVLDMVDICPQDQFSFRKNYQLLDSVNRVRTLKELMGCLWDPEADSLLGAKKLETTDMSSAEERQSKNGMPFSVSNITSNSSFRANEKKDRPERTDHDKYSMSGRRS